MEEVKGSISTNADIIAMQKEWDEISCPICLDHPHNAVLLICSSHEKGCRSYICDTSYRHSNCLDRFKKLRVNHGNSSDHSSPLADENLSTEQHYQRTDQTLASDSFLTSPMTRRNSTGNQDDQGHVENNDRIVSSISESMAESVSVQHGQYAATQVDEWINHEGHNEGSMQESNILKCPLCRGTVSGWMIVKETRQYLDLKPRSCSRELCLFSGNYRELRRHARRVHPATRPADIDPSRQRAWHRLENQREYGDILSAIRSAMPGAVVLGDFVIDNGNDLPRERDFGEGGGPWLTTFFLLHMISSSSIGFLDEPRGSSRPWRTHRRSYGHRTLWGPNLLGLRDDDDDDLNPDDDVMIPRRRRRFTRSRHNEEQQ